MFIKSECVHFGSGTDVVTGSEERPDPNLLYRRVEVISYDLVNCQCLASRRWEFEACGCREVESPGVHECHDKEGILISYQLSYLLSVSGINETYTGSEAVGRQFNELKQASCIPVFSNRTISQTGKNYASLFTYSHYHQSGKRLARIMTVFITQRQSHCLHSFCLTFIL